MERSTSFYIALIWCITSMSCSKDNQPNFDESTIDITEGNVQLLS